MALKAHLELVARNDPSPVDGRRHPRRALNIETSGMLQAGSQAGSQAGFQAGSHANSPSNVTIHNLSAAGLLIETDLELVPGERLAITLPDAGPVGAEIVWMSERLYGCAFEQALGEAALAAAQLQSGPPQTPELGASTPKSTPTFGKPMSGNQFGTQLNRLRRERSLTLEQVANALGVSKPTVWAWEKGKARPLPERIAGIAELLGVPETELSGAGPQSNGGKLVEECRLRIASEYRISPEYVHIMIEV